MKRLLTKGIGTATAVVTMLLFSSVSQAAEPVERQPLRQLGRGVSNILTGVFEIPRNIMNVAEEEENSVSGWTYGLARGLARFGIREAAGVYEVGTFLRGRGPMILPEFPFGDELGVPDWQVVDKPDFMKKEEPVVWKDRPEAQAEPVVARVAEPVKAAGAGAAEAGTAAVRKTGDGVRAVGTGVKKAGAGLASSVSDVAGSVGTGVRKTGASVASGVSSFFRRVFDVGWYTGRAGATATQKAGAGVKSAGSGVASGVSDATGSVASGVSDAAGAVGRGVKSVGCGVRTGVQKSGQAVGGFFSSIGDLFDVNWWR
jgi:putative exosortase-associated protein (TIGR04073 family)